MNRPSLAACCAILVCGLLLTPGQSVAECPNHKANQGAMWLSILHPGLGELQQLGWKWENVPHRKVWFGFIPGFGWPGYLQVKSARDSAQCRTNDEMFNWDAP